MLVQRALGLANHLG